MEIDKIKISKQQEKANAADAYLSRMIEKYTDLINNLEKSKKQLIKDANEKALLIIEESNKAVEKTIRDIKEAGADKVKTREIRKELYTKKDELKDVPKQASAIKKAVNKKTKVSLAKPEAIQELQIKANDYVKIRDTDIVGEVINIDGNVALLNVNDIKLKITVSKLVKSKAPKQRPAKRKGHSFNVDDINKKAVNFKLTLDLRGKRADEALLMLKKYIDEAILLNMREVSILHGKGYGILRDIIRQYLQNLEEIKNFGDAPIEMGGTGITRVNLK
jgi:DNA mismatch repair protein MutS2